MIYQNLEFHNVAELQSVQNTAGLLLQRFPESVRYSLGHGDHERGRFYAERSVGCEIRFVTDAPFFRITLSTVDNEGMVFIYKGSFLHAGYRLQPGLTTTLHVETPPKFDLVQPEVLEAPFSPRVWRILFGHEACFAFHHLETFGHAVRPPQAGETPALRWLAYGSSITFGGNALLYTNTYIQQAAKRLGADVSCKGMPGSCFCDPLMVRYITEETDWDFITLELGVNMRGRFNLTEFEERVRGLIRDVRAHHPGKPMVAINIYPNGAVFQKDQDDRIARDNLDFNRIVRQIVSESDDPQLYFIDGSEILTDFSGLTTDLLHPSDDGHIRMGENLARRLGEILKLSSVDS